MLLLIPLLTRSSVLPGETRAPVFVDLLLTRATLHSALKLCFLSD